MIWSSTDNLDIKENTTFTAVSAELHHFPGLWAEFRVLSLSFKLQIISV